MCIKILLQTGTCAVWVNSPYIKTDPLKIIKQCKHNESLNYNA